VERPKTIFAKCMFAKLPGTTVVDSEVSMLVQRFSLKQSRDM
jgi:hypothetical protein